jgi:two-component system nitrate/nitrite response regulator NarL
MSVLASITIRTLLVDDHPIVRAGLRMLIQSQPGLEVVGEASNGSEALSLTGSKQPDIIVLDLDLGDEQAVDLIPDLLALAPQTRVLVLTGIADQELHLKAARLGAMGLVSKEQPDERIIQAIQKVHAGEAWFDGSTMAKVLNQFSNQQRDPQQQNPEAAKIASLTARESEIIQLVCQGLKNQQIAERLFISEGTVRNHLTVIYHKLGVTDRFGLIVYANQNGLNTLTKLVPTPATLKK